MIKNQEDRENRTTLKLLFLFHLEISIHCRIKIRSVSPLIHISS